MTTVGICGQPQNPSATTHRDTAAALALSTALAYAALDQGAFYPEQFGNVLALLAVALLSRFRPATPPPTRPPTPVVLAAIAWTGFAGWALLRAAQQGDTDRGLAAAAVALGLAAAAWSAGTLGASGRRLLAVVIVAVGVVVAVASWLGVALHLVPLALPSGGLWRAASTLTYANATAALLVVAVLVALATIPDDRSGLRGAVLAVLGLGLATTMSRAGLLALLVGLVIAARAPRLRRRVVRGWPVLPAVLCGWAGLLPSFAADSPGRPAPAVIGLIIGAVILRLATRRPAAGPVVALLAVPLAAATLTAAVALTAVTGAELTGAAGASAELTGAEPTGAVGAGAAGADAAGWAPQVVIDLLDGRLTLASAERADLVRVTWAQFVTDPVVGVGPGRLDLAYVDHSGVPVLAQFAHQEYLQLAAETGLVGLLLVLAGAAALAVGAARRAEPPPPGAEPPGAEPPGAEPPHRAEPPHGADPPPGAVPPPGSEPPHGAVPPGPAAALAVLAAFAVHSAFDFLWHVPVLPLLVVLAAVVLVPSRHRSSPSSPRSSA